MRKDIFRKRNKRTISNWFERMSQRLGGRAVTIASLAMLVVILAIILVIVFKISSRDKDMAEGNSDNQAISWKATADGEGQNGAAEDMPVVETATEGMKTESTPDTTVLAKKEGAKEGYLNRCVFLGDSRTVAMVNYGFFNDDAALAQIGISHPSFASNKFINNAGKEYTLKTYLKSHQAPVIYILLGVNGINDPSESHYQNTFISLIDSVAEMAPNSNIVLVAIGPVDDNGIYKKNVQNAWIDKYNEFLLKTAREKHIFFLNIAEILKGPDGQVKPEYNGGDGLHYSGQGCEAIFRYIVEHPVPRISDDGKYVVKYIKPDPKKIKVTMDNDSGIDKDKLDDLMGIMMGNPENEASSEASTLKSDAAASEGSSLDEEAKKAEEEKKKAEEEKKKKAEEEEKKKLEEEKKKKAEEEKKAEEARKKAEEEEKARKEAEEEEARRKAEEEEKKKAQEEGENSAGSEATSEASEENEGSGEASTASTASSSAEASTGQPEGESGDQP